MRTGVKHGHAAYYYENGALKESGNYVNNKKHGLWKTWNKKGILVSTIPYKVGEKHGSGSLFHDNGIQKMTMTYDKNAKVGTWISYNEKGDFLKKTVYKKYKDELFFTLRL
ncbi:MAG: toxin-antitoxin system YwqK family antitoxin [Cyclobacteriaceae bacterium]